MGKVIYLKPDSYYQHCDLEFFFACKRNILKNENMPKVYKDICPEWLKVKSEILWNNRFITIDRNPLTHGEWYRNGIVHVKVLPEKNGTFYSHSKIGELFNVKCSFLDILQVRNSLNRNLILLLRNDEFKDNTYTNTHICNLNIGHMTHNVGKIKCSDLYWLLISPQNYPTDMY